MKKEKILINIEKLNDIEKYKKIGINNFLFAVDYFSIGYTSFNIEELKNIKENKYLIINRILNSKDVDKLKKMVDDFLLFDGIIFEDIAVYNIFKDKNINYWLENVDSAIISNELTNEEINEILNSSNKKLVLNVFGKNPVMYSRRTLISNFCNNFNIIEDKDVVLRENVSDNEFEAHETDFGTILFNNSYFNLIPYLNELNNDKILFYLIYPHGLKKENIKEYINGKTDGTNDGFRNKKTIYKLGVKK